MPLFLANRNCIVLTAFSPLAGGYNIGGGLPLELIEFFGSEPIQAYAASGKRVAHLGQLERAIEMVFKADQGAPEAFRGLR